MATDLARKRLAAKGLQTRKLGGAIPKWELIDPQRGYTLGRFGMGEEKEKRVRAKSANIAAQRRQQLHQKNISPLIPVKTDDRTKSSSLFSNLNGHGTTPKFNEIDKYLSSLGSRIQELKQKNQFESITPDDLVKITGLPVERNGGWDFARAVVAAAERPDLVTNNVRNAIGRGFSHWFHDEFFKENRPLNDWLTNAENRESVKNLIKESSLNPAVKDWFLSPNEANLAKAYHATGDYANTYEQREMAKEIERRAKKWEAKHGEKEEERYVEGLVGSADYEDKDNPTYQRAQKERADQRLDEYRAAGKGTPSQKKLAKYRNPDLYDAGYPQGQQTEIPERQRMEEPTLDFSKIRKPEYPTLNEIIDPNAREAAIARYNKEQDQYEHEVMGMARQAEFAANWNDKILAREKALKKERQQLLAENTWEDNLKMQRKLLKDKKKEYSKAKYQREKEKHMLGAHDFWNVLRGQGSATPNSVGSIGEITRSLAAANQALKQGPKKWRSM
jgi:hypothetical protein